MVAAGLLSACASSTAPIDSSTEAQTSSATAGPSPTTGPATAAPSDDPSATGPPDTDSFPRDVTHALGVTTVPERPERVVALDLSLADATLALGQPLFGYTLYQDPDGDLPGYLEAADEDLIAEAEYLGELLEPDLEAIAASRPDLIISSAVRHEGIYDQLSGIAPTIMSESTGTRWKQNIHLTADALGEEDRADQVLADFEDRAATVGAAINDANDEPVVSVVRFSSAEQFSLYQPSSFSGIVLDDAGLARPDNQQATGPEEFRTDVSVERLPQADLGADVLFYTFPGNDDPDDARTDDARDPVVTNPLWTQLPTVEAGQAHEMSEEIWMSAVGLFGAHAILDDLAEVFEVDPAR